VHIQSLSIIHVVGLHANTQLGQIFH